ncbi:DNA-directed RNA polymerase subunit delta [Neobacillus sp. PS3-34]|uniref:DNA-directed RNA polymerase subunit delta n=1 Tax=Neobacillus sp. PS3-34 TaxID=3070678 RepID=UPI0027E1BF48|nr:DNA-directed RNA polymerase subunit delta [Neobacillus sp. PS3-34]WML50481.1 DNA-directed RNA polymerase subunit delta [Neobacillus sp. PS3-34]
MSLKQYSKEELKELSFIEMAYQSLLDRKQPIAFTEMMNEIAKAIGLSEKEVKAKIAQFYTDLNIDGRFLALGENNSWGLRVWYPVEQYEEEMVPATKPKKKKAKKAVDDDYDLDEDLEYEDYSDDDDDLLDEDDEDDAFDDIDEVDDVDDVEDVDDLDEDEEIIEDDEFALVDDEEEDEEEEEFDEEEEL